MGSRPVFQFETSLIREIISRKQYDLKLIPHARIEMKKDGFDLLDVRNALQGCWVVDMESAGVLVTRYTVQGRTSEGVLMTLILEIEEKSGSNDKIKVVTVWKN